MIVAVKFVRREGYLFTDGPIYNPVSRSRVTLTLTVTGPDFEGTQTVTVIGS